MSKTLAEIEAMIEAIENDDQVRDVLDALLELIAELEEKIHAPPVKPGKRP